MITLPKIIGPLVELAAHDARRYAIKGVHVQSNGTVCRLAATDGHVLGIVQLDTEPPGDEEALVIPADSWRQIFKLAKIDEPLGLDGSVALDHGDEGHTLATGGTRMAFEPTEGHFPNYLGVLPEGAPLVRIKVDARLLLKALKAVVAICPDADVSNSNSDVVPAELLWWANGRPFGIMARQPGSHALDVVVMPLK